MKKGIMAMLAAAVLFAGAEAGARQGGWLGEACGQKTTEFEFVADYSGSMMLDGAEGVPGKLALAKAAFARINAALPEGTWQAGLRTLAPAGTVLAHGRWDRKEMAQAIASLKTGADAYGRMTNMGDGLGGMDFRDMKGTGSVIILATDGDNNRGLDVVTAIAQLHLQRPGIRVHVLDFSDTEKGRRAVRAIAGQDPRTIVVPGERLATDDLLLAGFIERVFADSVAPILPIVNFEFGSDRLTPETRRLLDGAADRIIGRCGKLHVLLEGYADEVGTQPKNIGLSQRRADAVKRYLVSRGVEGKRLMATGFGESKKYGSDPEGRAKNRRVVVRWE